MGILTDAHCVIIVGVGVGVGGVGLGVVDVGLGVGVGLLRLTLPMLFPWVSVNQRLPSDPAVIHWGKVLLVLCQSEIDG
jgi:hypothetical protein